MIAIGVGTFASENVLPMVGPERPHVFPLGVAGPAAVPDRQPMAFTDRLTVAHKRILEPRNHLRRFWLSTVTANVIVGKSNIKGILIGNESGRYKISPVSWGIIAAVVSATTKVPGTLGVRNRITSSRLLTDPENRCNNVLFPGGCIRVRSQQSTFNLTGKAGYADTLASSVVPWASLWRNGWHHVLNRGIDGWQLFPDDCANEHFLECSRVCLRGLTCGFFKAVLHDSEESGLTINRYIHLNPVRIKRLGEHEARAGAEQRLESGRRGWKESIKASVLRGMKSSWPECSKNSKAIAGNRPGCGKRSVSALSGQE